MIKKILIICFVFVLAISVFSQNEAGDTAVSKTDIPERIKLSLDGLYKTRTSNGVYNLRFLDAYYYVFQQAVFVNVLFTADLDASIKTLEQAMKEKSEELKAKYDNYVQEMEKRTAEENLKIEEKNKKIKDESKKTALKVFEKPEPPVFKKRDSYHNLYLRVVRDGMEIQKFKSPVPYDGSGDLEYFSFGLILEPGKYDLLIAVDTYDDSEDGTLLAEIEVPKLTLADIVAPGKSIEATRPVFYKAISTLTEPEKRFTVVRNNYQIGLVQQMFEPYVGDRFSFRSGETPVLTFFLKGASMAQANPPWNLSANISIRSGKTSLLDFKPVKLENPFFFQPLRLTGKDNGELKPGSYSIQIDITDNNKKGLKGEIVVPFEIVE